MVVGHLSPRNGGASRLTRRINCPLLIRQCGEENCCAILLFPRRHTGITHTETVIIHGLLALLARRVIAV
jgi:hypothetical protein